jgi:hypothetical protein
MISGELSGSCPCGVHGFERSSLFIYGFQRRFDHWGDRCGPLDVAWKHSDRGDVEYRDYGFWH